MSFPSSTSVVSGRASSHRVSRRSEMAKRGNQLRMSFDPDKAPVTKNENPNYQKSQKVIDDAIAIQKEKNTKIKKAMNRKFEKNFNKWREYDLLACLIAFVGLALAIVDWEYTRNSAERIAKGMNDFCVQGDGYKNV